MGGDDDPGRGLPCLAVKLGGLVRRGLRHLLHRLHGEFATGIVGHSTCCCRRVLRVHSAFSGLAPDHTSCIPLERALGSDPWCDGGSHRVSLRLAVIHCGLLDGGSQGWPACSGTATTTVRCKVPIVP